MDPSGGAGGGVGDGVEGEVGNGVGDGVGETEETVGVGEEENNEEGMEETLE